MTRYRCSLLFVAVASLTVFACSGNDPTPQSPQTVTSTGSGQLNTSNGFVVIEETRRAASGVVLSRKTTGFDPVGNTGTAHFENFDPGASAGELFSESFAELFSYDDNGRLLNGIITFTDATTSLYTATYGTSGLLQEYSLRYKGGVPTVKTFFYNDTLRLVRRVSRVGNNGPLRSEEDFVYGTNGRLQEKRSLIHARSNTPLSVERLHVTTYSHNDNGQISGLSTDNDNDGSIDGSENFEYDTNGNMIRQTAYDQGGAVIFESTYTYAAVEKPVFNSWISHFRFFL